MAADEMITNLVLDAAMQPEMSAREKALRDLFVVEYLKDYSAFNAALRCGFMRSFAKDYAERFMGEPYVQQQLDRYQQVISRDQPSEDAYNKNRVLNGLLHEAHRLSNSGSTRVSALLGLAKIYGLDVQKTAERPGMNRGGVMAVPAIANIDDWEDVAVISQEKLVQHARD